jgi:hypothetical protein
MLLPLTSRSPSFWLSHQNSACITLVPTHATCCANSILIHLIILYISGEVYKLWSTTRHFVSLRSKYSPQCPVLKHPQSVFLLQCQRPRFAPIQNYRKNYNWEIHKCHLI